MSLTLPNPSGKYDPGNEAQTRNAIEQADAQNLKNNRPVSQFKFKDQATGATVTLTVQNGELIGVSIPASALPTPTATTLGGVESFSAPANEFLTGINTSGAPQAAQPAMANVSDYAVGTWTPTDASGAGLSFTVLSATYTRIGNAVLVEGCVSYPTTANGNAAAIGGLPLTIPSRSGIGGTFAIQYGGTGLLAGFLGGGTTHFSMATPNGSGVPNSGLSGTTVRFQFFYPLS